MHSKMIPFLRDPTPDGIPLLEGIPKFLPYNSVDEAYLEIDEPWLLKSDYTLTYTATEDEMNPPAKAAKSPRRQSGRHRRSLGNKINYFGH